MDVLIVIAGLLSFVIVGLCILSLLDVKIEILPKSALGFGLGAGTISATMFLYSLLAIPISILTVFVPWYILFIYLLGKGKVVYSSRLNSRNLVIVDYIFIFLIFACISISILYNSFFHVASWDAIANWSMLAKSFFYSGQLSGEVYRFFNFDNPPLVSLNLSLLSILLGYYNDREVMLLFSAYYISLTILFYYLVKKLSTTTNSLIFTFLFASTPLILGQAGRYSVGYADLPLAYFIFSSVVIIYLILRDLTRTKIFLLGTVLTFCALTKSEGVGIVFIESIIIFIIVWRSAKLRYLIYMLIGLVPFVLWKVYSDISDFPVHYLYSGKIMISRTTRILQGFTYEFLRAKNWNFLWITTALSFFLISRGKFINIVITIFAFQVLVYFSIYLITPIDFVGHMDASIDRFLLHVSPLALLIISYAFSKPSIYNEKQK